MALIPLLKDVLLLESFYTISWISFATYRYFYEL